MIKITIRKNAISGIIFISLLLSFSALMGQQAPVTTAPVVASPELEAEVDITVTGFNDIGAISLTLHYDPQVALATLVTPHSSLAPGAVSHNTTTPGEVIVSWYNSVGVTLSDHTVLFTITFDRVSAGTTSLSWFDNGTSCEYAAYAGATYPTLNDQPTQDFYQDGSLTFLPRAPHTTLPQIDDACEGHLIEVPVTVTWFNNIGVISLTMLYDENVLDFQGFTPHPALPANFVAAAATPGVMVASGYTGNSDPGITLPDHTVLFSMQFLYLGGTTTLAWFDNGISCEYAEADAPHFTPLYDSQQADFYFNGSVDGHPRPTVEVTGTTTIDIGQSTDITFTLTGTPPWELTWSDGVNNTLVPGITTSPYILNVSPLVTTTYTAVALSDLLCEAVAADLTGEAVVNVRYAPGTHLPQIDDACEGHLIEVPVTVSDFNNIGVISLTMLYDDNVLDFQGFTPHPALPANFVAAAATPGTMVASGYIGNSDPGITLPEYTVLFTMQFLYLGGTTTLAWFDNGISCEYAEADAPHFTPLPDAPQQDYYFDGAVDGHPSPTVHVSGSVDICPGEQAIVTFDLTGTPPWTLTYSENGTNTTTVSGITTSPYQITRNFTEPILFEVVALEDEYCTAPPANITGSALVNAIGQNCALHLKTFLQGAYSTTTQLMRNDLNALGYLPLDQPYGTTPLAYAGQEQVTSFLPAVVDWIVVELRTGSAASAVIARQAALVLSNGDVVSAEDQQQPPSFSAIVPGEQYYVVIYHRNHLPVMTASAITLPNTATTPHDFTITPLTNHYGGNTAVIELEPGMFGQVAGDINMDNKLIYSGANNDRGLIFAKIGTVVQPLFLNSVIFGYYVEDLNMNGEVRYSGPGNDQGIIISNIDQLTDPTFLNTVFTGPVPVDY